MRIHSSTVLSIAQVVQTWHKTYWTSYGTKITKSALVNLHNRCNNRSVVMVTVMSHFLTLRKSNIRSCPCNLLSALFMCMEHELRWFFWTYFIQLYDTSSVCCFAPLAFQVKILIHISVSGIEELNYMNNSLSSVLRSIYENKCTYDFLYLKKSHFWSYIQSGWKRYEVYVVCMRGLFVGLKRGMCHLGKKYSITILFRYKHSLHYHAMEWMFKIPQDIFLCFRRFSH